MLIHVAEAMLRRTIMDYRRANVTDLACLEAMRKQQLIDEGLAPTANIDLELQKYFQNGLKDGSFISWLAEDRSTIGATSGLCFYRLPPTYSNPTGHIAYVTNMFTKKDYRKRGIASKLLGLVLDEAKQRQFRVIRLHTSHDGRPMYVKAGFVDSNGYMSLNVQ
jgi:ribosomal protein S18 acetylase RimI-like enzyme